MRLRGLAVDIQPMSEYSTVRNISISKTKNVVRKLDLLDYVICKNSIGLSIYEVVRNLADNTLKYNSKKIKPFAFIAGLNFFSSIPKRFGNYNRYKRGSIKYKVYIRNLKFFYNF